MGCHLDLDRNVPDPGAAAVAGLGRLTGASGGNSPGSPPPAPRTPPDPPRPRRRGEWLRWRAPLQCVYAELIGPLTPVGRQHTRQAEGSISKRVVVMEETGRILQGPPAPGEAKTMEGGSNTSKVLYRSAVIFFLLAPPFWSAHRRSRLEHEDFFTGFFCKHFSISNAHLSPQLLLSPFYFLRIISLFLLRGVARLFCVSTCVNVILRLLFFPSYGGGVGFFFTFG